MQTKTNFEVVIVTVATFLMLLSANASYANSLNKKTVRTAYESEALQYSSSPKLSKASYSKFHRNRYYGYKSNRNYYRGKQYYRGNHSYHRSNRYYNKGYRYYKPRNNYYRNQYKNRFRYYRY